MFQIVYVLIASAFAAAATTGTPFTQGKSTNDPSELVPKNLQQGLVLYYCFAEDEKSKVTDLSGSGNHGQTHGAKYEKQDADGTMLFDGKDDYISVPDIHFKEFTFAAWLKNLQPGIEDPLIFLSVDDRQVFQLTDGKRCYALKGCSIGSVVAVADGFGPDSFGVRVPDTSFGVGAWTHVVLTNDGRTFTVYWNGQQRTSGDIKTEGLKGMLTIGGTGAAADHSWRGVIDDVAVFDRALSDKEIHQLFSAKDYSANVVSEPARPVSPTAELNGLIRLYERHQTEDDARAAELEEFKKTVKTNLGDRVGRWKDWMREPSFFKELDTPTLSKELFATRLCGYFSDRTRILEDADKALALLQLEHGGFAELFKREDMWKGILLANEDLSKRLMSEQAIREKGPCSLCASALEAMRILYVSPPLKHQIKARERLFLASALRVLKSFKYVMDNHNASGLFYPEPVYTAHGALVLAKQVDPEKYARVGPIVASVCFPDKQRMADISSFTNLVIASLDGFVTEADYKELDSILGKSASTSDTPPA